MPTWPRSSCALPIRRPTRRSERTYQVVLRPTCPSGGRSLTTMSGHEVADLAPGERVAAGTAPVVSAAGRLGRLRTDRRRHLRHPRPDDVGGRAAACRPRGGADPSPGAGRVVEAAFVDQDVGHAGNASPVLGGRLPAVRGGVSDPRPLAQAVLAEVP